MPRDVLAQRRIELRGFLKGDAVPRVIETLHTGVGNARGESVGLCGAYQDVFARTDQKRGRLDLRETRPCRVARDRMELSKDSSKRGRSVQAHTQMRAHPFRPDRLEELRGVEQARKGLHPNLAAAEQPFEKQTHPFERRKRGDRRAIVSRDQRETLATVGRTKRDLLRDHASHRHTDDVRPIPTKIVHDPDRIFGHRRNGSKKRPTVAVADAQMVVVAATMVRL